MVEEKEIKKGNIKKKIKLSQVHNKHIFRRLLSLASVAEGGEYP